MSVSVDFRNSSSISNSIPHRDVDKIADLMDDIQEQQDIATEISDAISNPVGFGADVDEDELLAELDELEQVSKPLGTCRWVRTKMGNE